MHSLGKLAILGGPLETWVDGRSYYSEILGSLHSFKEKKLVK